MEDLQVLPGVGSTRGGETRAKAQAAVSRLEMLQAICSGDFANSRPGRYLQTLREHFDGPVLADMLCYLRLQSELSLRAKGVLMMRESGFPVKKDQETAAKLAELRYLRHSIGETGELALAPVIHRSAHDLWQLQMLEE